MKRFFIFATIIAIAAVQLQGQNRTLPKTEFTINVFGGVSTPLYKFVDSDQTGTLNLGLAGGAGFGLNFFFSNHIGLATGLEAALYNTAFSTPSIKSGLGGSSFTLNNFEEKQSLLAIQLPLMLKIMMPLGQQKNNHFYVGLGGRAGYSLMGNFNQSAESVQPGRDGFQTGKKTLKFGAINAMASAEIGMRWRLGAKSGLYTGLYGDYGLLDISPTKVEDPLYMSSIENNNSILAAKVPINSEILPYVNKVSTFSAGLKIKIAFGGNGAKTPKAPKAPKPAKEKKSKNVAAPASAPAKKEEPAPPTEVPQDIKQAMVTLSNTLFAFDKFNLTPEATVELDKVVKWLKDNPTVHVEIEGHTDGTGAADYNMRLSQERAKSVYDYFVSHGVNASRLSYRGYGLTRPIATNATEAGRKQNRRVELIIK